MSAAARADLWARAEALSAPILTLDAAALAASGRGRALARRLAPTRGFGPPLTLEDVVAAPDWATWPDERRARLARLAGAVAVSGALSRCISGPVLKRAAEALGEAALDAVTALGADRPAVRDRGAENGEADALARLGAAALLAEVERPALRARLAAWFEDAAPGVPDDAGREIAATARRLFAEREA